jgi:hypothetical protein
MEAIRIMTQYVNEYVRIEEPWTAEAQGTPQKTGKKKGGYGALLDVFWGASNSISDEGSESLRLVIMDSGLTQHAIHFAMNRCEL